MRWLVIVPLALLLAGCGSAPPPAPVDPTTEAWYGETVQRLAGLNRDAEQALASGHSDAAAAAVVSGQDLEKRLLSVRQPTLAATEAVTDLDRLYGRMLFANRHYGWARIMFQKNLARWKYWRPESPESARRLQQAKDDIAECDKYLP
ncbi:MAG TPA: hypothetical protein VMJ34_20865 [Bryobacteraceae bacterium]|nr:hypothetical protein [Bryobacteraceae bacterium]